MVPKGRIWYSRRENFNEVYKKLGQQMNFIKLKYMALGRKIEGVLDVDGHTTIEQFVYLGSTFR